MPAVIRDGVEVPGSQISLRSVEDSARWSEILSQHPEGPNTVLGLHITGVEPFPSLLAWPKLENLRHIELQSIDFRASHEPLTPFFDAHGPSVEELVLERSRFQELDQLFALVAAFKNVISLTIHDVNWERGELLGGGGVEFGSGSESDSDETQEHPVQPGECCSLTSRGLPLAGDRSIDLPRLTHLSLRGCSSTIAEHLTRMPSRLRLSRLETAWEDEHLLPLSEMIESCAPFLSELSISGVFHTECDCRLSLSSCTRLSSLYLNEIHLFFDEPLGPALYHLVSTLPTGKSSHLPRSVNLAFTLDPSPTWKVRIDEVDWDATVAALTLLESRLDPDRDHWDVSMKVDPSYLSASEDEERQILDIAKQKLGKFSAVLQLDTH